MLRLKLNYVSKRGPRLRPQLHGQYLTHDIFICVSFNENQLTWLQMPLRFVVKGPIYSNTKVQEMAWHHAIIWSKVDTDIWRHGTLDDNMVMGNYVCVLILRRQHHVFSSRNLMQRWNLFQDDFIKRKHYPRYWPFVRRIHRSQAIPRTKKGQWRGALMFSLICVWINSWIHNREAGDLRYHRTHCHVRVMT